MTQQKRQDRLASVTISEIQKDFLCLRNSMLFGIQGSNLLKLANLDSLFLPF